MNIKQQQQIMTEKAITFNHSEKLTGIYEVKLSKKEKAAIEILIGVWNWPAEKQC